MTQKSFTAQMDDWVKETEERVEAVVKQSAQTVIEKMQTPVGKGGNMPVDTGFLRASLQASIHQPYPANMPNPGRPKDWNPSEVVMAIAGFEMGTTLFATYTAEYAGHVEYGARGRPGRGFVRLAAQQWPVIVAQTATELRNRVTGGNG